MGDDVETLRAQLAQAEARARAAEAEAARARVEAARAALGAAEAAAAATSPEAGPAPEGDPTSGGEPASEGEPASGDAPTSDAVPAVAGTRSAQDTAPHGTRTPAEPETPTSQGTDAAAAPSSMSLPDPGPEPTPSAPGRAADTGLSPFARQIRDAYSFDVPSLTMGTLLDAGVPAPGVSVGVPLGMLNRHMLVAGATGTGKTRTLQLLTEGLSTAGTPVLLCDVKGDLTGLAEPGVASEKLTQRTRANGQEWEPTSFPVELLSLGGAQTQFPGTTVRTSVSALGPILLARALSLNTTQEQSLQLVFRWADQRGLELVDLADLRAVIAHLTSPEGKPELATIGGVSSATAGVILRALTTLEAQGGGQFFGEPSFDTADLLRQVDGRGVVSLLGVGDMAQRPALVSTVIMWLLADLFSGLPEVGDPERPELVFFFDEAHLLFADATKEFQRQVVQTVRLIRSKGVGIVFVTQTPKDIPADVLAQLGSRVQHALRAVTPEDQKKLRQTVDTFPRTELELDEVLTTLGTGEAVVTVLAPDGRPTPVAPTRVWAPASVMGPAQPDTVAALVAGSSLAGRYASAVNPDSAEEKLARQAQEAQEAKARAAQAAAELAAAEKQARADAAAAAKAEKAHQAEVDRAARAAQKQREKEEAAARRAAERRSDALEKALGNAVRSAGTQLGREITRSIFGTRKR